MQWNNPPPALRNTDLVICKALALAFFKHKRSIDDSDLPTGLRIRDTRVSDILGSRLILIPGSHSVQGTPDQGLSRCRPQAAPCFLWPIG